MGPNLKHPKQKQLTLKVLRSQARERTNRKKSQSEAAISALRHLKATNCKKTEKLKERWEIYCLV